MKAITTLRGLVSRDRPPQIDPAREAREALRLAIAARSEAVEALPLVQKRLQRVQSSAEVIAAAGAAVKDTHAALVAFVSGFLERGEQMQAGADSQLRAAHEEATRRLSQVSIEGEAAEMALPALHASAQEAKEEIARAAWYVDEAIGAVLLATLRGRSHACQALLEKLNHHIAEVIAVKDLLGRRTTHGCEARGTVPNELIPIPRLKFTDEQLLENTRPWKEFARRLRNDPNAEF